MVAVNCPTIRLGWLDDQSERILPITVSLNNFDGDLIEVYQVRTSRNRSSLKHNSTLINGDMSTETSTHKKSRTWK